MADELLDCGYPDIATLQFAYQEDPCTVEGAILKIQARQRSCILQMLSCR